MRPCRFSTWCTVEQAGNVFLTLNLIKQVTNTVQIGHRGVVDQMRCTPHNQHRAMCTVLTEHRDAPLHQILRRFGADLLEECWINGGGGEPMWESFGGGGGEL